MVIESPKSHGQERPDFVDTIVPPQSEADSVEGGGGAANCQTAMSYRPATQPENHETTSGQTSHKVVNVAVRETDGEESANTVRAWVLGLVFVTIISAGNMFLSMRWPVVNIPTVVVVLLVQPIASLWAKWVPRRRFKTLGLAWSLNPGRFSLKEHAVVTLMANVIAGFAYPSDALLALCTESMYGLDLGWGFQILFTLSCHLIGIGLAGLLRRFLVWPSALVWPANFSAITLLYALHDHSRADPSSTSRWRISGYRYFGYVAISSFLWYWIPGVLWKGLSVFSFVTWIRPQNVILNQLFGGYTGMSLVPLTFDWTVVISWLQDPLLAPTAAHLNVLVGLLGFIIAPAIVIIFTGALYSGYLPLSSNNIFDNTQHRYDVTRVLRANFTLDSEKYKGYSPLFLSPTYLLSRGASFAALIASIVHVAIFHKYEIGSKFWVPTRLESDIHVSLMRKYRQAHDWWYACVLLISVSLGLVTILLYPSQMPWWAYFASLGIALISVVPCGIIYSTSNIMINLSGLSPFLAGFLVPGRPIAVMIFEIYCNLTAGKVQVYSQDLKLAHYLKVPPRVTFSCQAVATVWASFVQVATMNWALRAIGQACTPDQKDHFTCPNARSFFSSSVVFGVIGPSRVWGSGATYAYFNFSWLFGLLLPLTFYALLRVPFMKKHFRWVNAPIMLGSITAIPPASPLSYFAWVFFGLMFNHTIRKRFNGWWRNYNYLTAAGLDCGLLISTIVVVFSVTLSSASVLEWWGNSIVSRTLDANGTAIRKTLAPGETFGPGSW